MNLVLYFDLRLIASGIMKLIKLIYNHYFFLLINI